MTDKRTRGGNGASPSAEIQVLVSMLVAAVLMTAVAVLALAVEGTRPPRLVLAGAAWEWTGSAPGGGEAPLVVPDPASYTIQFRRDGTFRAAADCNEVSGTYTVVPAGRAGGASNGLALVLTPASPAPCGAGSLSAVFVQQLQAADRYAIAGSQLTITLAPHGAMDFSAAARTARRATSRAP